MKPITTTAMARPMRATAGSLLALALAACTTLGPDYAPPPFDAPAKYKQAKDAASGEPTQRAAAIPRGAWWTLYGDDVLNALEAQVEVSNQSIRAFEARSRQAGAQIDMARATYYPALGIAGTNQRIGPNVRWELDLWGRIRRTVEANTATAEASADDLEAAKLSAQAQLAQAYFLLRAQDAEIGLLQGTTAAYEKSLQLTRNQYAAGMLGRGDVAQAEAQWTATRALAIEAAIARSQYEHAIAVLIGKAPADFSIAVAPLQAGLPPIPAGLPTELLQRRPDIAAAERRMAAANAQIGITEASFYPSGVLGVGVGLDGRVRGGASVDLALFDAGLRKAQARRVAAGYDEAVANYRQAVLTGFAEVEDQLAALHMLEAQAAAQNDAVKAVQETARIAGNQYREGLANHLALAAAQTAALNNERVALGIRGRGLVASVNLIKALGGGWQAGPPAPMPAGQLDEISGSSSASRRP